MSGRLAPHQIAARCAGEPKGFVATQERGQEGFSRSSMVSRETYHQPRSPPAGQLEACLTPMYVLAFEPLAKRSQVSLLLRPSPADNAEWATGREGPC